VLCLSPGHQSAAVTEAIMAQAAKDTVEVEVREDIAVEVGIVAEAEAPAE